MTVEGIKTRLVERLRSWALYLRSGSYRTVARYERFRSRLPIAEKTVLFEAYHGARISCNPYAIFLAMLEDPEFAGYRYVWTLNDLSDPGNRMLEKYRRMPNVEFHARGSKGYLKHLASAKHLVNNKTFHYYFVKRPEQVHISTWHGVPLKTLGKDQYGSMGQYKNTTRNYLQTDYLVMPNRFTSDVMLDSCDVRSLFPGHVIEGGYPRTDLTLNTDRVRMKAYLGELLGIDPAKTFVLYAPTWRGEVGSAIDITDAIVENIERLAEGMPEGHELLLKVHDKTYAFVKGNPALAHMVNIPDWFETNELLAGIDILVTDYSSIFFDFLSLRRPIIHFVFDRAEYERTRGTYFDMDTEMPGPLCYTADEVNAAIRDIGAVTERFRERHEQAIERWCANEDGRCARRVIDIVFHGRQLEYAYRTEDTARTRVLVYAGSLDAGNARVIHALSDLDFDAVDLVVLFDGSPKSRDEYYLTKLHPKIKVFYRASSPAHNIVDRSLAQTGVHPASRYCSPEAARAWRAEFFGDVRFDVAVDLSGRASVWHLIFAHTPFATKIVFLDEARVNDPAASPASFMAAHFDNLVCTSSSAFDFFKDRLAGTPAASKLVLCRVPSSLSEFFDDLRHDVSHVLAGAEYVLDCFEKSLDPYCETSDLLLEFQVGGLPKVDLARYPELAAAVDEFEHELSTELAPYVDGALEERSAVEFARLVTGDAAPPQARAAGVR